MKDFISSCHNLGDLMGVTELTDTQLQTVAKNSIRKAEAIIGLQKPLTELQEKELERLIYIRDNPTLLDGAKTLLNNYYAYKIGLDRPFMFSKETQKGLMMEHVTIELIDEVVFGSQGLIKNKKEESNKFIKGTCDVKFENTVVDAKSPYDMRTFLHKATETVNNNNIWQLKGYGILFKCDRALLCYGLVDTPNYAALMANFQGKSLDVIEYESTYNHIPETDRLITYIIELLESDEKKIEEAVIRGRDYLTWYESELRTKLGTINKI